MTPIRLRLLTDLLRSNSVLTHLGCVRGFIHVGIFVKSSIADLVESV